MRLSSCFALSAALGGLTLFSGCSPSQPDAGAATAPTKSGITPALSIHTTSTPGSRADSLGGIPGHHFGDPLSSFPGLRRGTFQQGVGVYYEYADGRKAKGWFGKHEGGLGFMSFIFLNGKFAGFSTMARGRFTKDLINETLYLFGHGQSVGLYNVIWQGKAVEVKLREGSEGGVQEMTLWIDTQEYLKADAQALRDKAKAENAQ